MKQDEGDRFLTVTTRVYYTTQEKRVHIEFGDADLSVDPEQARGMAFALVEAADKAEGNEWQS